MRKTKMRTQSSEYDSEIRNRNASAGPPATRSRSRNQARPVLWPATRGFFLFFLGGDRVLYTRSISASCSENADRWRNG